MKPSVVAALRLLGLEPIEMLVVGRPLAEACREAVAMQDEDERPTMPPPAPLAGEEPVSYLF